MSKERVKLNNILEKTIEAEVNERVSAIKTENEDLREKVERLQEKIIGLEEANKILKSNNTTSDTLIDVLEIFNDKMYQIENKPLRGDLVYRLLDALFVRTFEENTYECPTWLGALTNFYDDKHLVIDFLKVIGIHVPEKAVNFRLPQDWTEEELDIVFETMSKHFVCNNQTFESNLRFWKPNALDSVYDVCHCGTYTEIPWQFLLNPNLLKEKYLVKMGKMAWEQPYIHGWRYLFHIEEYQELTDEQIKTIIGNINPYHKISPTEFESVNKFLLKHVDLIEDGPLLESIYTAYHSSYDFKYKNIVLKMPTKYIEKYIQTESDPLEWIKRNRDYLTDEQRKELLKLVMEKYLGGN